MALPGAVLVRLGALCNLGKSLDTGSLIGLNYNRVQWYKTKARRHPDTAASAAQKRRGNDLLKQYPEPKNLLFTTISRALGLSDLSQHIQYHCTEDAGVKRATVTLLWPSKMELEGTATRKIDAERYAAAAACHKLRELGVLRPDNQVARAGRGRVGPLSSLDDPEESRWTEDVQVFRGDLQNEQSEPHRPSWATEDSTELSQALSMFTNPKALLNRVVQMATSSNNFKELVQYKTVGGKVKHCELTMRWPEDLTFVAASHRRMGAERKAAALACLKLKEMKLLDENNQPLTHVKYHKEEMREAGERDRKPYPLEIPEYLEQDVREYLTQYPVAKEMQKLWEEEEEISQQRLNQQDKEEEEDLITDAITGKLYRPLSTQQAEQLSADIREEWERAGPGLGVELPVDAHQERVLSAVESSQVVVIAGETGCGKTTRIPRFLLEGRVRGGQGAECNILVTQPRRISAVSVAHRVANEMGPSLRHSVGYQVRLESRPPEHSGGALLFLTVGVLLRKLQSNASLRGISHVVVDEVHERDVNTDLLLALLKPAIRDNPHLRVVLMSATGDNQRLAQYFGGCPVVSVPGFMHPVRDLYLEDVLAEMGRPPPPPNRTDFKGREGNEATPDLDLVANVIEHIHRHGDPGAVLCFLPGWQDIKAVQQRLEQKPSFLSGSPMILPLHSSMSVSDQQTVFQRPPVGRRKIVLATNIAETSITIDDIVHVVDAGSQKEQHYDARTKVSCLDTVWISRSNVTQRRGRAGRCQPGHAYHLFPRKQLESMNTFPVPEILRTPLESLVVQAKIHSPKLKAVDFLSQVLDSPEREAVTDAVRNLQEIGVLDKTEALTPLGERVAVLSCDPRLGKVLVLAAMFRCVLPLLSVTACLTRDPFHNSMQNRALVTKAKEALGGSSYSDYLVFSRAVLGWRSLQHERDRETIQNYTERYSLSRMGLRFINGLIAQFSENLLEAGLVVRSADCQRASSLYNQHSHQDELVKAVLLAGLYPNLIQVRRGAVTKGRFRPNSLCFRTQSGPVLIHRSSINRGKEQFPSRWLTFFSAIKSSGNVFIRDSSAVHPLALLLFTDCDITERVKGDRVEVAFPGRSLVRCELSVQTWELLWELRSSIQTMLYRNLRPHGSANHIAQDSKLICLLVELLNNTESNADPQTNSDQSDSEVD
ncbi:ATP-dependent RNA helicase DHX30 [Esox lucius]|uniref:ATP-dependent RNA helicase DHX30 n=1 Tax=Esox lucius TaxID=8010 RepID=A0A3P9AH49_ESOLU|nr:ATP-dependent RNA helicase DHX30 [Esox lucius]